MKQDQAITLAAQINQNEPHITVLPEYARRGNWRIRATFRPGPDAVTLTAATLAEWEDIRKMWAMLPVDLGMIA